MYKGLPAEEELYKKMVDIGLRSGMKTIIAKVHAVLFVEPQPVSLETLAEKTGYSLASVSNTVKHLELIKQAKRVKRPGSKRVYIQGEKNIVHAVHEQFKQAMETVIKPMQDIMPHIIKDLKQAVKDSKTGKQKKEEIKAKIAWYEDYLKQNKKIEDIIARVEQDFRKCEQQYG